MDTKSHRVTCLKCKGSNIARITPVGPNAYMIDLNKDHEENPKEIHIISGRFRTDLEFGWECMCGNDSRVARQEFQNIDKLVINGGESAIKKITDSLKITDQKKFKVTVL